MPYRLGVVARLKLLHGGTQPLALHEPSRREPPNCLLRCPSPNPLLRRERNPSPAAVGDHHHHPNTAPSVSTPSPLTKTKGKVVMRCSSYRQMSTNPEIQN
jgi:hypothetical protein